MTRCYPCTHCVHYACYEDHSTGWIDEDCKLDGGFLEGVRPCPQFRAIMPTEGLYEELAEEREYLEWLEYMREDHNTEG